MTSTQGHLSEHLILSRWLSSGGLESLRGEALGEVGCCGRGEFEAIPRPCFLH